ncbi:putative aliphatic sulfonates-binding protein precursor [Clostridium homopropionicum DSM 5847]|uniref:Putative aliphatic sulfonates-binding protein n=1 Tax=Clostridium homopropionicum DSM 5847 TaxID=1121318 RepID=A0A0L6Z5I0_9CLOT|nr:MetQ/NlpA family ABC transporter substrate-binding protein [Clostridium homopropionicum]KOA18093.1 putative aliphatic sulfonates-binding protein precursor [Clostridium homopropionicum DSM 5847]SFG71731.1 NitT/TauT family transport system substrate-binding protein [Clostridium homopropionicum]
MINYKKIFSLIITSMFAVSLVACSPSKNAGTSSKQTLNFGAMGSVDAVPFVIANEKGFFKEEGVDVNFQIFKNSKDRDAALQAGKLDGIIGDEVAICLYQNADFDVKITGVTDGDFMLIANGKTGIKSIKDINGKSVAISEKTAIEYSLDKILEKNSLKPEAVKKSIVPPIPTRLEMLRNNNVDAALLPEPFSSLAIKDGGILLGSARSIGIYSSISAFTQKSVDAKANDIKAFYRAYNKAVDYLNNTSITEFEDAIIKTVGYSADMKGKIKLPKFRKNILPSEAEVKEAIDWTINKGLVKKNLDPKSLMNDIGVN